MFNARVRNSENRASANEDVGGQGQHIRPHVFLPVPCFFRASNDAKGSTHIPVFADRSPQQSSLLKIRRGLAKAGKLADVLVGGA